MAEDRVINLEIKDNVKTLKQQYKEAVKELQQMAATYGEMSNEAVAAAKRAAELKDQIEDTNDLMQSFKGEGAFIAMNKAMTAVASGFSAIEGGIALTGVESEALQETMVKLQAAMALSQGLEGLEDAGRAFSALKTKVVDLGKSVATSFQGMSTASKAFAVTGVGLIITAISVLVANMDKLKEKFTGVTEVTKSHNEAVKEGAKAMADATMTVNEVGLAFEQAKKGVISKEQALKTYNEKLGATLGTTDDLNEAEKIYRENSGKYIKAVQARAIAQALAQKAAEKLAEAETAAMENNLTTADNAVSSVRMVFGTITGLGGSLQDQQDAINEKQKQRTKEVQDRAKEAFSQLNALSETYLKDALSIESELASGKAKVEGKVNKKEQNSVKERANYARQLEKEKIDAMEDGMEKRIKLLEYERAGELAGIDKKGKKAGELTKAIEERYLKEIQKVRDEYRDRSDRDNEIVLEKNKAFITTKAEQEIDAEKYVQGELAKLRQEENDKEIQRRKDLLKATIDITLQGLDLIASIAEANAGEDEKRQRAAFNIRKASNIAQATVDGYKAVLSTYADTPGGIVVKTIAATIAGGFAALKIGQIAKSKYESSASGGGGGGDLASGGTESFAPQFNVIGNSGINQLAQLTQQPVQAYVVSGEVTSAQALDRNRQKNATL